MTTTAAAADQERTRPFAESTAFAVSPVITVSCPRIVGKPRSFLPPTAATTT